MTLALVTLILPAVASQQCYDDEFGFIQDRTIRQDEFGFIQERSFRDVLSVEDRRPTRPVASLLSRTAVRVKSASQTTIQLQRHQVRAQGVKSRVTQRSMYSGQIRVGVPPQNFTAVFDTGSGNLLAPSTKCQDSACLAHTRFNISASTTGRAVSCDGRDGPPNDQLTIGFGTGTVKGTCWRDIICIGEACAVGDMILTNHESEEPFRDFNFDGVQGLSMATLSQGPGFHLMTLLQKSLHHPLFGVFLSESDSEQSHITFGELNSDLFMDDLVWMPVSRDSGYWELKTKDITIDDEPQNLCIDCNMVFDTGSSGLFGPTEVINNITELLQVDQNCTNFDKLPRLGFIVGDHILNLMADNYVDNFDGAECSVSFMALDVPPPAGPVFVLGIPFLQQFYTAYDVQTKQIGFALAKHVGQTISEPKRLLGKIGKK